MHIHEIPASSVSLYAAEFMQYAFHFAEKEQDVGHTEQGTRDKAQEARKEIRNKKRQVALSITNKLINQ